MTTTSNLPLDKDARIYVAGHRGMVGSAIERQLAGAGYRNVVARSHSELDLINQADVFAFLREERPDFVFLAAGRVGGIHANNTYRADFIYRNLMIEANVIHGAWLAGVRRLLFIGSSCIYPRECPQPIHEDYLLSAPLEKTNEPYALAKIAGVKLCESYNAQYGTSYFSVMATNLYGPNDNYDPDNSHVLPSLIRKAHDAKVTGSDELVVWGSGAPRREFLYVDDMADACVFLMEQGVGDGLINVGTGQDLAIRELAHLVMEVVGFEGAVRYDSGKPDGTPRKLLDVSRLSAMGWRAKTPLREGIEKAYRDYLQRFGALQ